MSKRMGNAFDSHQVLSLPFEGRDPAAILSLQPGVAYTGNNPAQTANDTFDTRNGAVNGGRSDQANITLDGVDNNDQLGRHAFQGAVRSTLESIEEFRVTTAGQNADSGLPAGRFPWLPRAVPILSTGLCMNTIAAA